MTGSRERLIEAIYKMVGDQTWNFAPYSPPIHDVVFDGGSYTLSSLPLRWDTSGAGTCRS